MTDQKDASYAKRKSQRKQMIKEIDTDRMVKSFDPELVQRVAKKAWGSSREVRDLQGKLMEPAKFNRLKTRDKIQAVVGFMLGVAESQEFQEQMTHWALENPGDVMKMIVSMAPREAEITHNHEGGVVLLLGKMDSIEDWQKEVAGQTIDGEVHE